ncbi:MAG TPA: DNA cytosine methyltransferase [Pseudonocardiaceae bacterium]|nr:DNA cytosine methyltransferase [Pseudonocardiaceae bacterium]
MVEPLTLHTCPAPAVPTPPAHTVDCPANCPVDCPVTGRGWWPRGPVIGSLCTGYGGLDWAVLAVLGGRVAWCADPDRHIQTVLAARLAGVVNLGDITTLDWAALPAVDVITAGFPCQDLSSAGNGAGITEGTRSGLWYTVLAAVRALRPRLVFVENVAALRWRRPGLDRVLAGLADTGYDASWRSIRASDPAIGAPHQRERVFLLAHRRADPAQHPGSPAADPADPAGHGRPSGMATGLPAGPGSSAAAHRRVQRHHLHTRPAGHPPPGG